MNTLPCHRSNTLQGYSSQYWRWALFLNLFPGLVAYFFIFYRVVKKGTGNTLFKSVVISLSFPLLGMFFPLLPCVWLSYHGYYLYQAYKYKERKKKEHDPVLLKNLSRLLVLLRFSKFNSIIQMVCDSGGYYNILIVISNGARELMSLSLQAPPTPTSC